MQNLFECSKCGAQNQIGDRSCNKCGIVFQYSCPKCSYPVNLGDAACIRCGNNLEWPSNKGELVDGSYKTEKQSLKQRKGSWIGPLIGLLAVVLLVGIGSYIFIKLSEHENPQVITENQSITNNQEEEKSTNTDTVAPVISNIQVNNLSPNSVEIIWETDELCTSQVIWESINGSLNTTQPKEAMVTQHSIELTGLSNPMTFYFRVKSTDHNGNETVSEQQSFDLGKQTGLAAVEVIESSLSIEEKPPISGVRTYVRGRIKNTGKIPVDITNIEIIVKVTVAGSAGSTVTAVLDPYPAMIYPDETHKFYSIVPNNSNPHYSISTRVLSQ